MSRADRVAGRLEDVDALLVTEPANLRYVTGFTGSNGFAVVGRDVRRFVTDFRYVEQAKVEVAGLRPRAGAAGAARRAEGLLPGGSGSTTRTCRCKTHRRLGELLPDVELVPSAGVVEDVRAVKEPGEILRIGAAAALVDEIYAWLLEFGLVGRTERDVAVALEHEMRLRGASGPSFHSIVASAEHGALPHAQPRDVAIARGHAGHDRHRRGARRLLLGLHAHVGDGRPVATSWPRPTRSSLRAQVDGAGRGPAGSAGARDRRDRARHHHRRRPRRALRPRARARRRPGHARGAAARAHRRDRAGRRATSSRSSRACICPASAACGSRISWSSPRAAATSSRTPRKSS